MAVMRTYERFTHTPVFARAAIDKFAAARMPRDVNGPPIVIPPVLGRLTFFVTERLTAPASAYDPPFELISWTNKRGFFLFSGETRRAEHPGTVSLTPGRYTMRVESAYYQTVERELVWPPPPDKVYDPSQDIDLLPGPAYPFPNFDLKQRELSVTLLRGAVLAPDGTGLENVRVELTAPALTDDYVAFKEGVSDSSGGWVLALVRVKQDNADPDFAHSRIRVHLPNPYNVDLAIKEREENSLRQTALRGRVRKPGGAPFAGVKITTSVAAGESITRADGEWFFYFELQQGDEPVTVTATTEDGRTAQQNVVINAKSTVRVPEMEIS